MDQLKGVSAAVKKYHFWVLCVIVVVGAVAVWQTTATSGDNEFDKGKKNLESQRTAVEALAKATEPHNDETLEELRQRQASLSQEVLKAWNHLYEDQKKANQWPSELGEAFRAIIATLKWGDEIPRTQRYEYAMFIKKCLPRLARDLQMRMTDYQWEELKRTIKTGGAEPSVFKKRTAKKSDAEADASKKTLDPSQLEMVGLVVWDDYTKFQDHFTWLESPSSLEIWLAQEDLWVYQALLQIIQKTNEGATGHGSAPVKRIIFLDIAQNAATALAGSQSGYGMGMGMTSGYPGSMGSGGMPAGYPGGTPGRMPAGYPGGTPGGMPAGYPGGTPGGMPAGYPGATPGGMPAGYPTPGGSGAGGPPPGYPTSAGGTTTTGTGSAESSDDRGAGAASAMGMPLYGGTTMMAGLTGQQRMEGRYVDAKAQPLPANSPQLSDESKNQFKMMPVRMVLVMDHRRLPRLLANCANSSMPVEVLSVNLSTVDGNSGINLQGTGRAPGLAGSSDDNPARGASPYGASPYGMGAGRMPASPAGPGLPGPTGGMGYPGRSGPSGYPSLGGGSGYSGGMPSPYGGGSTGASGGTMGNALPVGTGPYDVYAEIQGIIFIFEPPDPKKLGIPSAAEGSPAPTVSEPSEPTPVPSPAPPAATAPAPASTPPAAAAPTPASTPPPGSSGGPAAKSPASPPPPAAAPTGGSPPAAKTP